uniref:Secreted protein n=1 Tax=Heterorhabditis bacteriophora TaxID=37862 RepID=A0A1I7WGT9_HETBA
MVAYALICRAYIALRVGGTTVRPHSQSLTLHYRHVLEPTLHATYTIRSSSSVSNQHNAT